MARSSIQKFKNDYNIIFMFKQNIGFHGISVKDFGNIRQRTERAKNNQFEFYTFYYCVSKLNAVATG